VKAPIARGPLKDRVALAIGAELGAIEAASGGSVLVP
jgi:hypothetical protein